jgi:hypothetical protein
MEINACVPAVLTSVDKGFPGSLQDDAPGAAIANVVVFETTPPALIETGTQHPRGTFVGSVTTI